MADLVKAKRELYLASVAIDRFNEESTAFQVCCCRGDFAQADQHRTAAMAHLEAHFDHIAVAYRASEA